jgi:tellurite methyltransferase
MSSSDYDDDARRRWNRKYRAAAEAWLVPDPFLERTFSQYVLPLFPQGGRALDLAGGAGRHAIWLAKQGWKVTLIDISETGVEQARQNAGPLASHIHFAVDDLTRFQASQTRFEVVMAFFFLERKIFSEIVRAVRPGGLLIYKTHTLAQAKLAGGPKNPAHLLEPGELLQLASGLRVLHYQERVEKKAIAELVARKETAKEIWAPQRYPQTARKIEERLVRGTGLEPARPCGHWLLRPARLPVPPAPLRFPSYHRARNSLRLAPDPPFAKRVPPTFAQFFAL